MRVGFDLNGVVLNTVMTKIEVAKRMFGVDLKIEHASWRVLDGTLAPEDYRRLQRFVYGTSELLQTPAMSEQGRLHLKRLTRQQELFYVSCLQVDGVQFGRQWLNEHELDGGALISVGVGGRKGSVLQHGFEVYVDDKGSVLNSLVETVPHLFMLDMPYNRHDKLHPRVIRVPDWQELYERVREVDATKRANLYTPK